MTKRIIISSFIFLICVCVPSCILSFFPTPCGFGICLIFFYPAIFLIGILSALTYFLFTDRVKLKKWIQIFLILIVDTLLLISVYPSGEFSPLKQISRARTIAENYSQLQPTDLFNATDKRDFLLITALYHKFNLPKQTFTVTYCFFDKSGSCDTTFKTFNYFIKDNKVYCDNSSIDFKINFSDSSLTFKDTIQQTIINCKVGYPDFGKYKNEFENRSAELTPNGERITGLVKDLNNLRVITSENLPKFEYKFTRLFESYLDRQKKNNE